MMQVEEDNTCSDDSGTQRLWGASSAPSAILGHSFFKLKQVLCPTQVGSCTVTGRSVDVKGMLGGKLTETCTYDKSV